MKNLVLIGSLLATSLLVADTEVEEYVFPRKSIQCFDTESFVKRLEEEFGESPLLYGSSMNGKEKSIDFNLLVTYNAKSKTYSVINEVPSMNKLCVIDSGTADLYEFAPSF